MTPEQIKLIVEAYLKAANRPDGRASTISEYIKYILDGDIDLVTSKDCVILDEEKQLIHAIFVNEDMTAQASFPIKVLSTDFSIIQKIEGVFSQENFEKFLNEGFLADLLSEEKKKFIIDYTRARSNKMQAQQPREAEPFFNTNPTIIPMPHKRIEREEYVPTKVFAKDTNGNTVSFASMKEAITAVNEGKVASLKLTDNVVMGKDEVIAISSGNDVTIDLGNNTISTTEAVSLFNVSSGSLTITGEGTIESAGECVRVYTKGDAVANVTIGAGVKIVSDEYALYVRGKGATLTTAAEITSNSKKYAAITGNGTDAGCTINIIGGTIYNPYQAAIYNPQNGILNIENATIIGTTGIYTKAGVINISGDSKIQGIGAAEDYEFNNNGCNETGDAIVADFCKYPGGYPIINISGGDFYSKNAKAIMCYDKNGIVDTEHAPENVNISGGRFNTEPDAAWLAEGYTAKYNAVTKRYSVVSE